MSMHYPVAIEPGSDATAWGVVVPDLPGCFSAADGGLDEALRHICEAIALWMEDATANREAIPKPSSLVDLQASGQFDGWRWAMVRAERP